MAFAFEKLLVYQKSVDFADQVCSKTECFSRGYGFLTDQLNRAAPSIAANIAKGNGRFTKADRRIMFATEINFCEDIFITLDSAIGIDIDHRAIHLKHRDHFADIRINHQRMRLAR